MKISLRPAWPVPIFFAGLAGLSYALDFNGLYGQDAHEYLRQSQVLADRLRGLPTGPGGWGDAEMAGGYPLTAALLQVLGCSPGLAVQLVSWLAAAVAFWLFELNLRLLSPGARAESRWVFGALGLALAPFFVRAGLTVMSEAQGLALGFGALFCSLMAIERQKPPYGIAFAVLAALAVTTRYALVALMALPALALALEWARERRWGWLSLAVLAGGLALFPLWWLKRGAPASPLAHSLLQDWSLLNLFSRSFSQASGTITYTFPNIIYLLFPLLHPGFCLSLPAMFLLAKKTDARLYSKRLLLLSLIFYLLFLGGFQHQNLRYLLPAYLLVLLLLFPAWDRFFAYGLYFFRRLTYFLLALALACQLFFTVRILAPTLARNRLERDIAAALHTELPLHADLYAFDLDIALQTYLPDIVFHNLWAQRYDTFPGGSYILFNAPQLQKQWAGKNPMLNWEYAVSHYNLQELKNLPGGWTLYRVLGPI